MEKCRQRLGNKQQQFQSNSLIYSILQSDWSVKESFGILFALIDFVWVEKRGAALSFEWVSS